MFERKNGFTIVELLVVIVVIGILASVVVVAYTGIQNRTLNSIILSSASQYSSALRSYLAANDAYPPMPSEATPGADDRVCLGIGYTDHTNDSIPDCGNSDYPSLEYQPFNDALKTIVNLPLASDKTIPTPYQSSTFTGITFIRDDNFTLNGENNPYYMMYVLIGANQNCQLSVVEQNSDSDPFPHTKPSSQAWSWSDSTSTMCVVAMPNP